MKQTVYSVTAYRWGDRERHSYVVGVYPKKHAAMTAAETEEVYRGGKYACEVLEWTLGEGNAGTHREADKIIKPLPPVSLLHTPFTMKAKL